MDQKEFRVLIKLTYELNTLTNLILIGDCNAHIGEAQVLPAQLLNQSQCALAKKRRSKDSKIDSRGKQFLEMCEDENFVILNGRTLNDQSGEYTYISKVGCSVVDFCCVTTPCLPFVHDFKVLADTFSDHMPITLQLSTGMKHYEENLTPLLPKLIWVQKNEEVYQSRLEQDLNMTVCNGSVKEEVEHLLSCIKRAAENRKGGNPTHRQ
uniref:Endo/exonuclease/phosphatase domain-containing protein n=1 Tax=Rhodnius prolixus TaxID=13249 RepID=T1HRL5_RHOPR